MRSTFYVRTYVHVGVIYGVAFLEVMIVYQSYTCTNMWVCPLTVCAYVHAESLVSEYCCSSSVFFGLLVTAAAIKVFSVCVVFGNVAGGDTCYTFCQSDTYICSDRG